VNLNPNTVRNKVTRRVFGIFAVTALIPAIVTSGLAYTAVERQLTEKSFQYLRNESKNYALTVYQRLQFARDVLSQTEVEKLVQQGTLGHAIFSRIDIVDNALADQHGPHNSPNRLPANSDRLETNISADGPSIWLSTIGISGERLSAKLIEEYVWGLPSMFPAMLSMCVVNQDYVVIFCPDPPGPDALGLRQHPLSESTVDTLGWTQDSEKIMVGYFTLPLHAAFGTGSFTVAAIQSVSDAMVPMSGFRQVFPPAIGLSVILALWIALFQVRRRLKPLQELTSATYNIAEGDLSTTVSLDSNDEFEALAQSLDKMRQNLHRQFGTLRALSELDQHILTATDLQTVAESALRRMIELFGCTCASITVLDKDAGELAQVISANGSNKFKIDRIRLAAGHQLAENLNPIYIASGDADEPYLVPLRDFGANYYQVMPILSEDKLVGLITLGFRQRQYKEDIETVALQDYADRLAVALQTIDRAEELYQRAHYDSLTSLPNRQLFKDRLDGAIARATAHGCASALLFIDLDNFKSVNDSEGHAVGDKLLCLAAQRLRKCVGSADTIARLGGDEFTVILSDISSPDEVLRTSDIIVRALSESYQIETMEHFLGASIGITMIPSDGRSVDELLRNADTAMYRAKELGRGRSVFFEERMNVVAEKRVSLAADLQHAIHRDEFELFYQAKVSLQTQQIDSAEALLRWINPCRGLVLPDDFIPMAEETGLILDIGDWVIREGIRQLSTWHRDGVLKNLSFNVSYRQIRDGNVAQVVTDALRANQMGAQYLEVEITESMLADDRQATMDTLGALRDLGVRVSIDDFGTGYSSFSYLTELSFDTLKIDKVFVDDVPGNKEKTAVLGGIIQIGRMLGKEVVAEGVETPEQAQTLLKQGCHTAQGYLYSRPLPAHEFEAFIAQRSELKLAWR